MPRALCFQPDPWLRRPLTRALRALDFEALESDVLAEARAWLVGGLDLVIVSGLGPEPTALLAEAARLCPAARRVRLVASDEPDGDPAGPAEAMSLDRLRQTLDRAAPPLADLNREQILDCVQGDIDALDAMAQLFLTGARRQLERLRAALAVGDQETGRQALHRLQGAAATAGAERLAALCQHDHTSAPSPALLAQLEVALGAFELAYARWRGPSS